MTRDETISQEYSSGVLIKDLCAQFGLSKSRISTILKKQGTKTRFPDTIDRNLVLDLYESGLSSVEVAQRAGCSRGLVAKIVAAAGQGRPIRDLIATHAINANYFDVINTEQKAYWFGFILADGCLVNRRYKSGRRERVFVVGLAHKDRQHLEKLRDAMGSTHPIKERWRKRKDGTRRKCAVLTITCAELARGLLSNGWDEFKIDGKWPKISRDLERHLVRGLIDGDGWVSSCVKHGVRKPEIGLCCTHQGPLLESLRVLRCEADLLTAGSIWKWRKCCLDDLLTIEAELYQGATMWLARKREKLRLLLSNLGH